MQGHKLKVCSCCKIAKSHKKFSKNLSRVGGLQAYCKECSGIYNAKHQKEHPEMAIARSARFRKSHPDSTRYHNVYKFDQKRGFSTCKKEQYSGILAIGICIYCGWLGRIGADRIDNSKGHIVGNMLPCCVICNRARNEYFSVKEAMQIGAIIRAIRVQWGDAVLSEYELSLLRAKFI